MKKCTYFSRTHCTVERTIAYFYVVMHCPRDEVLSKYCLVKRRGGGHEVDGWVFNLRRLVFCQNKVICYMILDGTTVVREKGRRTCFSDGEMRRKFYLLLVSYEMVNSDKHYCWECTATYIFKKKNKERWSLLFEWFYGVCEKRAGHGAISTISSVSSNAFWSSSQLILHATYKTALLCIRWKIVVGVKCASLYCCTRVYS